MADFPDLIVTPLHIDVFSRYAALWDVGLHQGASIGGNSSLTWTVANTAYYIPVVLPFAYPVNRVFWSNGTSVTSTNMDFGIYTSDGARIYSTGSTAQSGASTTQYVTPGTPFILPPGNYYFAIACSSTTANRGGYGSSTLTSTTYIRARLAGIYEQTSALPLPAAATFAVPSAQIMPIPHCGITRTTTGF